MKKYLIVLFCALFGLAWIAQAANPDDVKKGKQKAPADLFAKSRSTLARRLQRQEILERPGRGWFPSGERATQKE